MVVVSTVGEAKELLDKAPSSTVVLKRPGAETWVLLLPTAGRSIQLPRGGIPEPRYGAQEST